jgi:hypothetical protein
MVFDLTDQKAGEAVCLRIPYPISYQNQVIANVKDAGDYAEAGVYTDRNYQTPMLDVRWNRGAKSRTLNFSFDAERSEVEHPDLPTAEGARPISPNGSRPPASAHPNRVRYPFTQSGGQPIDWLDPAGFKHSIS